MTLAHKKLLYVTNDAKYFLSHRLSLALDAKKAGYAVYVAVPEDAYCNNIRSYGFDCLPLRMQRKGMNPFLECLTLCSILFIYFRVKPDIIHLITIKAVIYGGILARFFTKAFVVNTISGLGYVYTRQSFCGNFLKNKVNFLYRFSLKNKRAVTVFQNKDDLALFLHENIIAEKQRRLIRGSGVDINYFSSLPLPEHLHTVALVSRMLWTKGIADYVNAARIVKEHYPHARFLLVGDSDPGNPSAINVSTLQAWHDEGVVEWSGAWCDDVRDVFKEVAVVCLPSYREGLPKVLLEAAACSRVLVTTDAPGCRELLSTHFKNAVLVPPHDPDNLARALIELFQSSRDTLLQMAAESRQLIERELSTTIVNKAYLEIYIAC